MARTKRSTRKAAPTARFTATVATLRSALERAFQSRASTLAAKLGIPRAAEVRALTRQVAQLQQNVEQLRRARARA